MQKSVTPYAILGIVIGFLILGVIVFSLTDEETLLAPLMKGQISVIDSQLRTVQPTEKSPFCNEGFIGERRCNPDGSNTVQQQYQSYACLAIDNDGNIGNCQCLTNWQIVDECEIECVNGECINIITMTLNSNSTNETVLHNNILYDIELISSTDTSATIKVIDENSQSEIAEIFEGDSEMLLDIIVLVNEAEETSAYLKVSADQVVFFFEIFEDTTTPPLRKVISDNTEYTIEFLGADESPFPGCICAMIRVTDEFGNTQTKNIDEGTTRLVLGIPVTVIETDVSNFYMSAKISLPADETIPRD